MSKRKRIQVRGIERLPSYSLDGEIANVIETLEEYQALYGSDAFMSVEVDDDRHSGEITIEYTRYETDKEYKARCKKLDAIRDAKPKTKAKKQAADFALYEKLRKQFEGDPHC